MGNCSNLDCSEIAFMPERIFIPDEGDVLVNLFNRFYTIQLNKQAEEAALSSTDDDPQKVHHHKKQHVQSVFTLPNATSTDTYLFRLRVELSTSTHSFF